MIIKFNPINKPKWPRNCSWEMPLCLNQNSRLFLFPLICLLWLLHKSGFGSQISTFSDGSEWTLLSYHSKHSEKIFSHCAHETKKIFMGPSQLFWKCSKEQFLLSSTQPFSPFLPFYNRHKLTNLILTLKDIFLADNL